MHCPQNTIPIKVTCHLDLEDISLVSTNLLSRLSTVFGASHLSKVTHQK